MITDKGYDAKANRDAARKRGVAPVIPYRSMAKNRPNFFPKQLYKGRARIEQAVGKLKRFKRIALRCEKTALGLLRRRHLRLNQIRPNGDRLWLTFTGQPCRLPERSAP